MLAIAVLVGGVAVVVAWAMWASRRDTPQPRVAGAAAPARPVVPPDPRNPFAAPGAGESSAPIGPRLFSPRVVALPSLFLTSIYGGTLAAWNWARVGRYGRAAAVAAGSVSSLVASIAALSLPPPVGALVAVGIAASTVYAFWRDQRWLQHLHPGHPTSHWAYAIAFGLSLFCLTSQAPAIVWILVGDESAPPWAPPPPPT
jgi:hypothetical protein